MNERKILNYVGQIIDLTHNLKRQPASMRYGTADGIATLARSIRDEVQREDDDADTD